MAIVGEVKVVIFIGRNGSRVSFSDVDRNESGATLTVGSVQAPAHKVEGLKAGQPCRLIWMRMGNYSEWVFDAALRNENMKLTIFNGRSGDYARFIDRDGLEISMPVVTPYITEGILKDLEVGHLCRLYDSVCGHQPGWSFVGRLHNFYFTFGQQYRTEPHPIEEVHPDGWIRVIALNHREARDKIWELCEDKFSTSYDEKHFKRQYFPKGETLVIEA